jgi:cytochrome bd-type quinol oxidase subunit 1
MSQTVKHHVALTIRRAVAVLLLILIIPTTVMAFWLYNTNRVVFDPNTYKTSLNNRAVYNDLFGALLGGFVGGTSLPRHAEVLLPFIVSSGDAANILFPSDYAQKQVDGTVDQLNDWLNGKIDIPNVSVNLVPLKDKLMGSAAAQVVGDILKNFPTCRPSEEDQLKAFGDNDGFDKLFNPLCAPKDPTVFAGLQKQLTAGLASFSTVLPDSWKLSDELNAIESNRPNANNKTPAGHSDQIDISILAQTRVDVWLQARLMVLLFLVPIAVMCLIVIVIVRATKTFFRWLSWALILSGFVSLIPVLIIALTGLSGKASTMRLYNSTTGISELAFNSLARGAIQSILNTLILGVLIQVAILIVVGLIAAFISILLTGPEPLLSDTDLEALIAVQSGTTLPPNPVTLAPNGR